MRFLFAPPLPQQVGAQALRERCRRTQLGTSEAAHQPALVHVPTTADASKYFQIFCNKGEIHMYKLCKRRLFQAKLIFIFPSHTSVLRAENYH